MKLEDLIKRAIERIKTDGIEAWECKMELEPIQTPLTGLLSRVVVRETEQGKTLRFIPKDANIRRIGRISDPEATRTYYAIEGGQTYYLILIKYLMDGYSSDEIKEIPYNAIPEHLLAALAQQPEAVTAQ